MVLHYEKIIILFYICLGNVRLAERASPVVREEAVAPADRRSPDPGPQAGTPGRRQALAVVQQRHRRLRTQVNIQARKLNYFN